MPVGSDEGPPSVRMWVTNVRSPRIRRDDEEKTIPDDLSDGSMPSCRTTRFFLIEHENMRLVLAAPRRITPEIHDRNGSPIFRVARSRR